MSVLNNAREARKFKMVRTNDETGVSGQGNVLDGIIWHSGLVTICWRTIVDGCKWGWSSITTFPNYLTFYTVHVKSHPTNGTVIIFEGEDDPDQYWKPRNGNETCDICGEHYDEHPRDRQWLDDGSFYLRRLCTGELITITED